MKQYNIMLKLDKGTAIPKALVTPAEIALLVAEHHTLAQGNPVESSTDAPDVERKDVDEVLRLKAKYLVGKVDHLFPGGKPSLPVDLKEATEMGLRTTLPGSKLIVKK